jgi:hypothetical protein
VKGLTLFTVGRFFVLSAISLFLGCTGQIISPSTPSPAAPAGSTGFACPAIPSTIGTCAAGRLLRASLTCGGDGLMQVALSPTPGGGTRFNIQFKNDTTFRGTVITPDPGCWIQDGAVMTVFFGATYTGDQGTETAPDGTTRPCIVQSKVVYSQFRFGDPIFSPWEESVKNELHLSFDRAAINQIFVTAGGPALPGRCARWRQMP